MGLPNEQGDAVDSLIENTLKFMHEHSLDFTRFFRSISALNPSATDEENFASWQQSAFFPLALGDEAQVNNAKLWLKQWREALNPQNLDILAWQKKLDQTNPAFVLRNHLLQNAIERAQQGEFTEVNRLFTALSDPYNAAQLPNEYTAQPPDWAKSLVLSCSS